MSLAALAAFFAIHLAAAVSPGPAVILAARTGLREGIGRAVWLALGLGIGACIWALAALFGLAVLFRVAPVLFWVLKLGGAAYLLYLAYMLWRHAPEPMDVTLTHGALAGRSRAGLFRLGLWTQLANPKPAVFFGTIFLTLVPPDAPVWALAAILGIILVNDTGWALLVSRVFSLDGTRRTYLRLKTGIDRVFGAVLAALGLKLALT